MKPGMTIMSVASITSAPAAVRSGPTASIRPLFTCTSARGSTPALSTVMTAPFLIR